MQKIKIYLRGENNRELQFIEIEEDALVKDISINIDGCDTHLFLENELEPKHKHHTIKEACIKHHDQIHCHRCNEIVTTIEYNGHSKELQLAPGTTVSGILMKVPTLFNISPIDAADLELELSDKTILAATDHIGSYVTYPNCNITLSLIHKNQIKG